MRLELFVFCTSPYCMKVKCYLDYKGLAYETLTVNPLRRSEIRFSGQPKVPVLRIDGEWKHESSAIGLWLEERFPQPPLLGRDAGERARILEMDRWVSESCIPAALRLARGDAGWRARLHNGRRLAQCLHSQRPVPWVARQLWPLLLPLARSIRENTAGVDRAEPLQDTLERLASELLARLDGGPFLGGRDAVSLADLSLYPPIAFPYAVGLDVGPDYPFVKRPEILGWLGRVQALLPANPFLTSEDLLERPLF